MDCQVAVVGSLDSWLPSYRGVSSAARASPDQQQAVSCSADVGNHCAAARADGPGAGTTSAAAPVPIPFSRAANTVRSCSPRASINDDGDDGDDDYDDAPPLDIDFLDCMARKQHSFLKRAMASRRGGAPATSSAAASSREAAGGNSCCETDSGVSGGRSSMWAASSSAASSAASRSFGWSGSGSAASSTFSGSDASPFSGSSACEAFGSYSKAETTCPAPVRCDLAAAAAAGGSYPAAGVVPSSSSSCISEGTVRRGRPRLTISSACSLPMPSQQGSAHMQNQHLGSLCKALSSPPNAQSLAASFCQHQQADAASPLLQQSSFGRILPTPSPHAGHHGSGVQSIAAQSSSHGSGHSHATSETAAAAAAFALSMISLPDNSDSEGYESCSDREAPRQPYCRHDDTSDDINLSASCGGSSTATAAELEALDEHAPAAAEAAAWRVQLSQLSVMRRGWLQSIASACGVIAAAGTAAAAAAAAPAPVQTQQPRLAAAAAAPAAVHTAAAVGITPVSTRRGLFEGTVCGGSPRNAWQWHGAASPLSAGAAGAQ